MSHFVAASCRIDGDCIVNQVAWSHSDPIAALATITVDDRHRKIHRVLFMNSEVCTFVSHCTVV